MADYLLTINGGSSSIKFAAYSPGMPPAKVLGGQIERIGISGTVLIAEGTRQAIDASDHDRAAGHLVAWLRSRLGDARIVGVGHRVVHGGVHLFEHQVITPAVVEELERTVPLDLAHLPQEIALIKALTREFADVRQVACFDTAFHHAMPRVSRLLAVPRKYDEAGMRRFGFHGLSYTFLMEELRRVEPERANGRVILAHLGSGASMAAVRGGRPVDTTMAFTPTAGLVMGTRPGDIDPGLLVYLMRIEKFSADELDDFVNLKCGLLGVSETSSDMRDLIAKRGADVRAAEAVELFCYQARKWIGALAAAMGGVDVLVFSGGIGEHSVEVRAEICAGLEFLGVRLDESRNASDAEVISSDGAGAAVRIIRTDEEGVIAKTVCGLLRLTDCD